jgi:hypothetical protein
MNRAVRWCHSRLYVALIRAYRLLPWRPKCRCSHPDGKSCSEWGIAAAAAGTPLVILLSVALACGQAPDYNPLCGTGNDCTGTGKCEQPNSGACPGQNPQPPQNPPAPVNTSGSGSDPNSGHAPCPPGSIGYPSDDC